MNMNFERKLPIPMDVKKMYPLSEELINGERITVEKTLK